MTNGQQAANIASAWQTLSAQKSLKTRKLEHLDGSALYEAYLAGWLIFEN